MKGSSIRSIRGVDSDTNILWNDEIIKCKNLQTGITLTLPPINALGGDFDFSPFLIIDDDDNASVNNITVQCSSGGNEINGQHSVVINTNGGSGTFKPTPQGYIFTSSASSQSISVDDAIALIIALG